MQDQHSERLITANGGIWSVNSNTLDWSGKPNAPGSHRGQAACLEGSDSPSGPA